MLDVPYERQFVPDDVTGAYPSHRFTLILIVIFIVLGTLCRVSFLQTQPPGLWLDEAGHGLDCFAMLDGHGFPLFFPGNCGREPIYTYLVYLGIRYHAPEILVLRLPSAIFGSLTIMMVALFVHKVCAHNLITILATGLFAFMRWHIHFSRLSFRANFVPLFVVSLLLAFYWVIERGTWFRYLVLGCLLGLNFYTYPAARILPILIIIAFFIAWVFHLCSLRTSIVKIIFCYSVALFLFSPLFFYARAHPETFAARLRLTSILSLEGNLFYNGLRHLATYLGMFHIYGDPLLRHNIPEKPMLNPILGVLFLLGGFYLFRQMKKAHSLILIFAFFLLLTPGIMSSFAPHSLRVLGVTPIVCVIAGHAVLLFHKHQKRVLLAASLILISASALLDIRDYFKVWRQLVLVTPSGNSDCIDGMNLTEVALSDWIISQHQTNPSDQFLLSPQLYFHATVQYLLYGKVLVTCANWETMEQMINSKQLVLLILPYRNAWWMRDSMQKRYAIWWQIHYGHRLGTMNDLKTRNYPYRSNYIKCSDDFLLDHLSQKFSSGNLIEFERFAVFEIPSRNDAGRKQ